MSGGFAKSLKLDLTPRIRPLLSDALLARRDDQEDHFDDENGDRGGGRPAEAPESSTAARRSTGQPVEEADTEWSFADPVEVTIGRGYALQLYYCPESEHHTGRSEIA